MSDRFRQKVVLITGASMGVGAAAARAFAREGAKLVLVARGREALEAIAAELGRGTEVMAETLDVTDIDAFRALLDRVEQRFGGIHVLVNNAGAHSRGPVATLDPASIARMVDVNLTAPLCASRLVLPRLERAGGGAVVNVASLNGYGPMPGAATYAATKIGLRCFTLALAEEVLGRNITVSLVSPGAIETGFILQGIDDVDDIVFSQPMSTAEQVASAIVDAASGPSREIAMPRTTARLANLAYLFPSLARWIRPRLRKKGAKVKARYKESLRRQSPPRA